MRNASVSPVRYVALREKSFGRSAVPDIGARSDRFILSAPTMLAILRHRGSKYSSSENASYTLAASLRFGR